MYEYNIKLKYIFKKYFKKIKKLKKLKSIKSDKLCVNRKDFNNCVE